MRFPVYSLYDYSLRDNLENYEKLSFCHWASSATILEHSAVRSAGAACVGAASPRSPHRPPCLGNTYLGAVLTV